MILPAAQAGAAAGPSSWIVGARAGPASDRIARRLGARPLLRRAGIFSIRRSDARRLAVALHGSGRLAFAEPNRGLRKRAHPQDPLTGYQWYLNAVAGDQTPPPVTASSPTLGIIDDQIDLTHPEWAGDPNVRVAVPGADTQGHGTATASVAGAPANGQGIVGVWPGMRILGFTADNCESAVRGIDHAIRNRVSVINMSYGFEDPTLSSCFAHFVATQLAFGQGIALVAAGGNEFEVGNYPSRPAADPHVLSVAAVSPDLSSPFFSNEGNYIDLAAPGLDIAAAISLSHDADGQQDGYTLLSGTSFAAPIVSAVASWLRNQRPGLDPGQVYDILRLSATDLGARGWDRRFGFGLVNTGRALAQAEPPPDPLEPNDDIEWIDGSRFDQPDAPIFRATTKRRRLTARLDALEDPVDVYRIVMPRRSRLRVTLTPLYGDPDLEAYSGSAETVYGRLGRISASRRSGRRTDSITLTNRRSMSRQLFVDTYVGTALRSGDALDSRYRLTITRIRFRR
jgi:Subtilase family